VEKFIGDAVMAVFGLSRSYVVDAHRAIRSSLAMLADLDDLNADLVRRFGVTLHMRVGIDTGEVVVSTLGERGDSDFVVVGEAVNRAARFQSAAPPGGILISAETFSHVRGSFGIRRLESLQLKGIARAVDGYLVLSGEIQSFWPETRGIEGITTRTVGRELEMGRLRKLFADVGDEGTWNIVTVSGEAGIGKSRLIHDFEHWLASLSDPVWVMRGRAAPNTEDVPHGLLRSAFAERLGIQDTDDPDVVRDKWRRGLTALVDRGDSGGQGSDVVATWLGFSLGDSPELVTLRVDPEALRRRARQLVINLFSVLSERAPVVILLEDLHWADAATLDWLEEVGTNPPPFPLLVVATARPSLFENRPHWGEGLDTHTEIRLAPLSKRESRDLVTDILQRADSVPDELRSVVVSAAEGNPYFIEELVKWLIDEGVIETDAEGWKVIEEAIGGTHVPGTLRGVLQARLDSLDRSDRSVIERASVVGRVFWDSAVATLGESDSPATNDESYERLRSREVVFQRPTSVFEDSLEFSFRHALLRDVAYEGVLRSRRRRYHALAARWLEDVIERSHRPDEHASTLAHHLEESGDGTAAARWYLRAGRHAAGTYANDNALQLLTWADRLAPPGETTLRFDILAGREAVLDRIGSRDAQRETLDVIAGLNDLDDARRAQAQIAEGRWRFFHSDYAGVDPFVEKAARLARQAGRTDLELDALTLGGRALSFRPDHLAAREYLEEVLARARSVGSHRHVGETLRLLGIVATNLSEHEVGIEVLEEAGREFRQIGDLEGEALVTGQLGAMFIGAERYEEGRQKSEEALAMFVATGHRLRQGIILGNLAAIAIEQGRLDEALRRCEGTLELTEALDDPEGIVSTLSRLGEVARLTGDPTGARGHLERAIALGAEYELQYFLSFSFAPLAVMDLLEGEVSRARHHVERAFETALLSEVPHALARATLIKGLLQLHERDFAGSVDTLRTAIELHEDVGHDSEVVDCRATLAVALLEAGDTEGAVEQASQARIHIVNGVAPGSLEPGRAILNCHQVMAAVGDPAAGELVALAGRFLEERAALIADEGLRARSLTTPVNVELAALATGSTSA
ncbi:MAG: ATP-binding protein, partial [Acidimicrobiia bacterium]